VVKLTTEEYSEELLHAVRPDWAPGLVTTHTYNRAGGFEVVDGQVE
jgi:hypothetical protein